MNHFAEAFAWCMLQVTLFSLIAAGLYGVVARFRLGGAAPILVSSLATVGLLTLLCASPWPQWIAMQRDAAPEGNAQFAHLAHGETQTAPPHARSERMATRHEARGDGEASQTSSDDFFSDQRAAEPVLESSLATLPPWPIILVTVAGMAAVVGLLRLFFGAVCLWLYCRSSRRINDRAVHVLLDELAQKFLLRQTVAIRESPSLRVAATAGWRRPIILLPAAWRGWTPEELRAVLAHELAHIKQQHFPVWVLSQLPLVAHYYHPLVHWLVNRLRLEQELAADDVAARLFGRRSQYAKVLAGLALGITPPRGLFTTLGLFMSRPFLMRRIAMLRQTAQPNRFSHQSRMFALLLLGFAAASAVGLRSSHADESEKPAAGTASPSEKPEQPSNSVPTGTAAATTPSLAPPSLVTPYVPGELHQRPGAVALFQVSRTTPSLANTESELVNDGAWQILCKTQLAKLKSYYVLQEVLRDSDVASLPLIRAQQEPLVWLADNLDVGFYPGSEILYVRLFGKRDEIEQLTKIVDAVAKAYEDEVIFADTQQRLSTRHLLAQTVKKLNDELTDKMQTYLNMAKEMGKVESGGGRVAQEIDLKRLDRIETELMRLENALLELETSGQAGNTKFYEQRIAELRKRQAELEQSILARSETSVDLAWRSAEIEQLQRLSNELGIRLEMLDVEANAAPRIKQLQRAIPTGVGARMNAPPETKTKAE